MKKSSNELFYEVCDMWVKSFNDAGEQVRKTENKEQLMNTLISIEKKLDSDLKKYLGHYYSHENTDNSAIDSQK